MTFRLKVLTVLAVLLLLANNPGRAADVSKTKTSAAIPTWTGVYAALGGGFGTFTSDHTSTLGVGQFAQPSVRGNGAFGTLQLGADYQFADRWVVGVFGDVDFSDIRGVVSEIVSLTNFTMRQRYALGVGARLGFLMMPQMLAYVDGGYARASFSDSALTFQTAPGVDTGLSVPGATYNGFFAGGGLEFALYQEWSLKTEYRYAQYNSATVTVPTGTPVFTEILKPAVQTGRLSLVYKFR